MKKNNEWSVKNERRQAMRGNRSYAEGRKNRRMLANKGAFGNLSGRAHNLCAIGTHSSRLDKDEE